MNRRTRLKAYKPLRRKSRLRTSKEQRTGRRDTGPDRTTRDLVAERDDYTCACCGESVYGRVASIQHRDARRAGGSPDPAKNRPSNLVLLCGSGTTGCHGACEKREKWLNDLGFWLNSWQRPALEPVAHAIYGWVFLLDAEPWVMPVNETGSAA